MSPPPLISPLVYPLDWVTADVTHWTQIWLPPSLYSVDRVGTAPAGGGGPGGWLRAGVMVGGHMEGGSSAPPPFLMTPYPPPRKYLAWLGTA